MTTTPRQRLKHKYQAVSCETDGIKFHSKRERDYYLCLKRRQEKGEIIFFLRQTPIHLPGNIKYIVDFLIFFSDGNIGFIDVKGFKTKDFIMKKKMVESLYPIEIEVV